MGTTKTTVFGVVVLLLMGVGVFTFRAHLLGQRTACAQRLQAVSKALGSYAMKHGGALPATPAELETALNTLPRSTTGETSYRISGVPLQWKNGEPQPYLWDHIPHPFVDGIHVLYSDGSVRLMEEMPQ